MLPGWQERTNIPLKQQFYVCVNIPDLSSFVNKAHIYSIYELFYIFNAGFFASKDLPKKFSSLDDIIPGFFFFCTVEHIPTK